MCWGFIILTEPLFCLLCLEDVLLLGTKLQFCLMSYIHTEPLFCLMCLDASHKTYVLTVRLCPSWPHFSESDLIGFRNITSIWTVESVKLIIIQIQTFAQSRSKKSMFTLEKPHPLLSFLLMLQLQNMIKVKYHLLSYVNPFIFAYIIN